MPTKKKLVKKKKIAKKVTVDRKFLMDLANLIYDRKTRKFLRLCDGTLQNGPDPTNPKRPMHCGLGELYFAMTGLQPEATGVGEEDVIDLAVKLSPLNGMKEAMIKEQKAKLDTAKKIVKSLDLSADLASDLIDHIDAAHDDVEDCIDESSLEKEFRDALDEIPGENDDGCGDEGDSCTISTFRERSKRVAEKLREAAALLPK
jgi:hypothetical protein